MPTVPKWVNDALEKIAPSMLRMVQVFNISYLNPQLKKIRLQGDFSKLTFEPGYTISFRVNDNDLRHYTVSYADAKAGVMEFIAHIHGDAVGAKFIDDLKPRDEIKMAIIGGSKQYDSKIKKQLIFGDETSLSLMVDFHSILKENEHQYQFYIELDEENINAPKLLRLENYTVFSKNNVFRNKEKIRELPIIKNDQWKDANVVLTGNITSLQNFRKVLKEHNHKGKLYVKGFWLEGKKGL